MAGYSTSQTSGRFMLAAAADKFGARQGDAGGGPDDRYLLMHDLYIKARSAALINKAAFWASLLFGIAVLSWPSFAVIGTDFGFEATLLKSTVVQTSITALAALAFAIYSHYKKRQMMIENLMRRVLVSGEETQELLARIVNEMQKIDMGFAFEAAAKAK